MKYTNLSIVCLILQIEKSDLLDVAIAADFDAGQIVRIVALLEAITQKMHIDYRQYLVNTST